MSVAGFAETVLNLLFPQRCPWCGKVVGYEASCGCGQPTLGLRLPAVPLELAAHGGDTTCLAAAWAFCLYEGAVREAILRFKFEGNTALALPLGDALAKTYLECGLAGKFDVVVPVPVSRRTMHERGYNQSVLLAQQLVRALGLDSPAYSKEALKKIVETRRQSDLDREERAGNVKGAYSVPSPQALVGKRVLLIDDIITTGSTLNECAFTLMAAGAAECSALCLAAARQNGE